MDALEKSLPNSLKNEKCQIPSKFYELLVGVIPIALVDAVISHDDSLFYM